MLFTDQQLNNIVKFCCHERVNQVSELGVDVTFQLGPFYVLVTSFKNTVLRVKGANNQPSFLGRVMICMTRDESTYLSFLHCLIREKPSLGEFVHATGSDDERAPTNALSAGFRNASPLLCYIHCQRNIKEKCRKLGLSSSLVSRIWQDLFEPKSGLLWSSSLEEFNKNATLLMDEWDTLERSEKSGPPAFTQYFCTHKLDDIRTKMAAFVWKALAWETNHMSKNPRVSELHDESLVEIHSPGHGQIHNQPVWLCSIIWPGGRNGVVCDVRQVGSLPPVSTILTNLESCMQRWPKTSARLSLKMSTKFPPIKKRAKGAAILR